ncbi:MAG TPA: pilin [Candidatus Pacearchaeota archaeon]|nr:pilin [Candidatus Pacearchaeota archaeon]
MPKTKQYLVPFFFFLLFALPVLGQGLVPCGGKNQEPCTFNDLFVLINNVIKFLLFTLIPPIAALIFAFGGITIMSAGGDPGKVEKGKKILTYGVVGVILIYAAWLIVYEFVAFITKGQMEWPLYFFKQVP